MEAPATILPEVEDELVRVGVTSSSVSSKYLQYFLQRVTNLSSLLTVIPVASTYAVLVAKKLFIWLIVPLFF